MLARFLRSIPAVALSVCIGGIFLWIGFLLYAQVRSVMEEEIRTRLMSTASAAASQIDGDILDAIHSPDDRSTQLYQNLVERLDALRRSNSDIRFAYIFRRSDDPQTLLFVADADDALSEEALDENHNGRVDADEEPGYPGESFDVSAMPVLQNEAFTQPSADREPTYDQWGALVSGYAPIYRMDGTVAGVLGIDMQATQFAALSSDVFSLPSILLLLLGGFLASGLILFGWEHNQLRVLRKVDRERSGLLRLTFHQLGEPLTIMKWSLENLREEADNPHLKDLVQDHVQCMDEGIGRLNSIIDTLQLAEKVELNTLKYIPTNCKLIDIINNTINEWSSSIEKRQHTVEITAPDDVSANVDPTLIAIVLRQLVQNAVEYSNMHGHIRIAVLQQPHDVRISVEDNGCGIPKKDMQHLFEKYRRASNAHLRKPDGNGLGLYIARGIVQKAGGKLWVESEQDVGTTVYFTLPRV